jgi:calcium channel MID1
LLSTLLVLLALLPFTAAQTNLTSSTLSDPSTIQFNLSSSTGYVFYLPPSTSTSTQVYVTLSLCSPPTSLRANLSSTLPFTLYVSNDSSLTTPGPSDSTEQDISAGRAVGLQSGFGNVSLEAREGAWIGVWAPDALSLGGKDDGGRWAYELGVSTEGPVVVLDGGASYRFEDSDASHALLTTSNYSGSTTPDYTPIIIPTSPLTTPLGNSLCYLRNSTKVAASRINGSTTTRGFGGGQRMQYEVGGLKRGTNYTSWLTETIGSSTRLWDPVFFTTKTGASLARCSVARAGELTLPSTHRNKLPPRSFSSILPLRRLLRPVASNSLHRVPPRLL